MHELPHWPPATVAVRATAGDDGAHAIPVSTALRAGPRTVLLALGAARGSLARLRADPRCALALLAGANVAVTLHGRAFEAGEAAGTVAVRLEVDRVQDHARPDFEIEGGVAWRWTDDRARERDAQVRAALRALAS